MFIDFIQFLANFLILAIALRWLQARYADTEWGKALAFIF